VVFSPEPELIDKIIVIPMIYEHTVGFIRVQAGMIECTAVMISPSYGENVSGDRQLLPELYFLCIA